LCKTRGPPPSEIFDPREVRIQIEQFIGGTWRHWVGTSILAALNVFLGLVGLNSLHWSPWVPVGATAIGLLGLGLTVPLHRGTGLGGGVFIQGDASDSTFDDVHAQNTRVFIGGDARRATFHKIRVNVTSRPWARVIIDFVLLIAFAAILGALFVGGRQ